MQKLEDPVIFAFNHNNSFETLLVPVFLMHLRKGRKISFVIDWMYGKIPIIGWFCRQIDPIYVYNKPAKYRLLEQYRMKHQRQDVHEHIIEKLERDQSIGIFPEGKRNKNPYMLRRGFNGVGHIALHARVPVIPIGIEFQSGRKRGKIPKFGRIVLRVGEPLTFREESVQLESLQENINLEPQAKKKISVHFSNKVTYEIMSELAKLSGKDYPFLPPALPGGIDKLFNQEIMR